MNTPLCYGDPIQLSACLHCKVQVQCWKKGAQASVFSLPIPRPVRKRGKR